MSTMTSFTEAETHDEIHELSESELDGASGGWGAIAGLANVLAGSGTTSGKGADVSKDIIMTAPLIG